MQEEVEKYLREVAVVSPSEELEAMQRMTDLENGPKKVKKMKDYEDGVHTGTASLVNVIGLVDD